MQISDEFQVTLPVEQAWQVLLDVERIAPCMPGAQLQEVEGDEYRGIVKVKVGPITAQYKGAARIVEADEGARRIVIRAEGRDTRGQGNAAANVTATLRSEADATVVSIDTDLQVTGKVAQFGRGVMAEVSSKLLGPVRGVPALDRPRRGVGAGRTRRRRRPAPPTQAPPPTPARRTPHPLPVSGRSMRQRPERSISVASRVAPSPSVSSRCSWGDRRDRRRRLARHPVSRRRAGSTSAPSPTPSIEPVFDASNRLHPNRPHPDRPDPEPPGPVLGIDPGLTRCGYGAVRREGGTLVAVTHGVVATPPDDCLPDRLAALERGIAALVADIRPSAVAVERLLFQHNVRTAMAVGQASGVIARDHGAPARAGRALQPQRGQARGDRVGNGRQGAGAGDGHPRPAPRRGPVAGRCRRRARARDLPRVERVVARRQHGPGGPDRALGAGRRPGDRPRGSIVIGSVRGTVVEREVSGEVLVEVGGVGYRVLVPLGAIATLEPGGRAFLFTHLHVRDDAMTLYGFPTAKSATRSRCCSPPRESVRRSHSRSCRCTRRARSRPRSPTKTSTRSPRFPASASAPRSGSWSSCAARLELPEPSRVAGGGDDAQPRGEVREALTGLGYAPEEIREVLGKLPADGSVEDLLRSALRQLGVRSSSGGGQWG